MTAAERELSQSEKRETLRNDQRVRDQQQSEPPATFHAFAQIEADTPRGRYTATERATVIGVGPPSYPQLPASSPWASDPVPDEPPLGFSVEEMQPVGSYQDVQASIARLQKPEDDPEAA